jgi:hypothetical protein
MPKSKLKGSSCLIVIGTEGGVAPELTYITAKFAALVPFARVGD